MRLLIQIIFSVSVLACKSDLQESRSAPESENILTESQSLQKPKVSFTSDDGITQDLASYEFSDWNGVI